jgi:PAS domain S-box-containing protein
LNDPIVIPYGFSGYKMSAMAPPGHESESKQVLEAQLRATLEVIPAYTWYADPSGALTFVNKRHADYLGLPKDHPLRFGIATGAAWDSHVLLLHPDDHEEARRVWSTSLRTGSAGEMPFRVRNAAGKYRWFLTRAEPLRASDGTLLYWIGVNLDIDDAKRAEDALRKSENELRDVIDTIPATVWSALPDGSNTYANKHFEEYSGLSAEETAGSGWQAVIHPDDLKRHADKWREAVASGKPHENEVRLRRSDGQYRWQLDRGVPLRDEHGNIVKWYGVTTDITDRKRAEDKIREQERELRQILDLVPQLVAVFGPGGERLYTNHMGLDYIGLSFEEWRQTLGNFSSSPFFHPDDRERGARTYSDWARSGGSAYELESRLRKRDGTYRWFLVRFNKLRDEQGQITRWYVALTDIEDRKQAEDRLRNENVALREEIDKASMFEEIVGTSPALQTVLSRISKVAPSDSTVLITGETGTGKELVARAIHRRSDRSSRAFVSVNCAAIPRDLIASELFGHEKGAFTGATQQRLGRFELANGGTLFLDEVGELPAETQIALLRVLQEHEFERVGGTRPIRADVRVIAATNRDLPAAISAGSFRSDLYYRLNVFPIEIPALRERKQDIPLLVEYFIDRYARKAAKKITTIDKKTLRLLESYPWPGNIRELQNVIERSIIVCETDDFSVDQSWLCWLSKDSLPPTPRTIQSGASKVEVEPRSEREIIEGALAESRGRVYGESGAAAKLGISTSTLDRRIKALKIHKKQFKFR